MEKNRRMESRVFDYPGGWPGYQERERDGETESALVELLSADSWESVVYRFLRSFCFKIRVGLSLLKAILLVLVKFLCLSQKTT